MALLCFSFLRFAPTSLIDQLARAGGVADPMQCRAFTAARAGLRPPELLLLLRRPSKDEEWACGMMAARNAARNRTVIS